jgi:protein-S-isoprenylcysteine O-methyltransferase Ste14
MLIMNPQDGQVVDLARGLETGTITTDQAVSCLEERGLTEKAVLRHSSWAYLIWLIPCFLPWLSGLWRLKILDFLTRLPRLIFPSFVTYIAAALFIAAIPLTAWSMYCNRKAGGCNSEDHTVFLLRRGPYAIIRHPSHFAWSVFFVTIPVFLSRYVSFTFLSIVGILGIVIFHYYVSIKEERELDIKKWGDEYRQYMEQVPRWNIIKGLVKLAKRK